MVIYALTGLSDLLGVRLSAGGGGAESEGESSGLGAVGRSGPHSQQHHQGKCVLFSFLFTAVTLKLRLHF